MKYRTDPILGEAFCIFIFFYFLDSGLLYWIEWFAMLLLIAWQWKPRILKSLACVAGEYVYHLPYPAQRKPRQNWFVG